jgi:hypothetical protein
MIRLGFGARLFVIFATSLVALQLLAVAVYMLQRSRATEGGLRLPLPDQAAALVELIETLPKDQWPKVLRAANSADLSVRIANQRPSSRDPAWHEAPIVDFILRRYLSAFGDREVRVRVEPSSEFLQGPLKALAWVSPGSVEIEVGLKGGETLIVSAGGVLSLSVLGLPPGFWAGILGLGIAAVALYLLRREARPIRRLADGRCNAARRRSGDHSRLAAQRAGNPRPDWGFQPPHRTHCRSVARTHGAGWRHFS